MRSVKLVRSVRLILLDIAVSICNRPGPLAISVPAVPQVSIAGTEKAFGLIHWLIVCPPGGMSDTPGTRFGRCSVLLPSAIAVVARETVTFRGSPVRIEATPLRVQFRSATEWPSGSG